MNDLMIRVTRKGDDKVGYGEFNLTALIKILNDSISAGPEGMAMLYDFQSGLLEFSLVEYPMTNFKALERFEQCCGASIDRMVWIAGQWENSEVKEMIEEMDEKDFEKCFPDIYKKRQYPLEGELLIEALVDFRKLGLLAVVHYPECDNFTYDGDRPSSWSVHQGMCRDGYIYAETLEELMAKIEAESEVMFQKYVAKDRKKNGLDSGIVVPVPKEGV